MRALTFASGLLALTGTFVTAQTHPPSAPAHAAEAKSTPAPAATASLGPVKTPAASAPQDVPAASVPKPAALPRDIETKLLALRERVAAARAAAPRARARAATPQSPPRPRYVVRWPGDRVTLTWASEEERVFVSWPR